MADKQDVIVIGGGAAGMTAAIACARYSKAIGQAKKIMLLEHNEKLGRKLSATGNGKCNYTNRYQAMDCYHSTEKECMERILSQFGFEAAISFFRSLGIYPKEKNGYFYPFSEQAASMIEAMRLELEHTRVKIKCREHITGLEKQGEEFLVSTETYTYRAGKVILATGGLAAPKLGSDGSGYALAGGLGLEVTELYPALTALKTKESLNALAGIRLKASISLSISNETGKCERYTETGELQLTAYGISGIPVFQISRFAAQALASGQKVEAVIDFLPDFSEEEVLQMLTELREQNGYKTAAVLCNGLLDNKLTALLVKRAGLEKNKKANELTGEELLRFCRCIKEFTCAIIDTNGFENAQTTAGGVSLSEISPDTMEAKRVSGLYLAGELLDVDGICGGYNLQWAWTTGYLAGIAAGKEEKNDTHFTVKDSD